MDTARAPHRQAHLPAHSQGGGAVSASRADELLGIREEIRFFGPDSGRMFGCLQAPLGEPMGGLVVCAPLDAEMLRHYRKEVLLGRALARQGIAVQRFHYVGSGNSDGDSGEVTFSSMAGETMAAAEWLRSQTAVSGLGFLGTRFGALVAARAAALVDGAPLVLWEPTVDASAYFREILRWQLMRRLGDGSGGRPSTDALVDEMRERGFVDVLGSPLHRTLYESALERTLEGELGTSPRPILLVQISLEEDLRKEYATLVSRWRDLGFDVEVVQVPEEVPWRWRLVRWEPEEVRGATQELMAATSSWLVGRFQPGRDR